MRGRSYVEDDVRLGLGGRSAVNGIYDRQHVESVLKRAGVPDEQYHAILDEIRFPIAIEGLQAVLARFGITHDGLIDRLGGSP
jgi:hypothetical protein